METHRILKLTTAHQAGDFNQDFLLLNFSSSEQLGHTYSHHLNVKCLKIDIDIESLLGTWMSVAVKNSSFDDAHYYYGIVTQIDFAGWEDRHAHYDIVLEPWLSLLNRTRDSKIFQNMTAVEVVKSIFDENGFSDYEDELTIDYPCCEYIVQYRETDFNFIQRLLQFEGIYYYFKQEKDKAVLVLCDSSSAHKMIPGCDEMPFYLEEASVRDDNFISNWNKSLSLKTGKVAINAYDFENPRANLQINSAHLKNHDFADYEAFDCEYYYTERGEGDRLAKLRAEAINAQTHIATAMTDCTHLFSGGKFKMIKHPHDAFNAEYLVTGLVIHATMGDYQSGGGGDTTFSANFTVLPSGVVYRPTLTAEPGHIAGPQTAIVVGPESEEIYTDKYGRVKVQFHWDRYGEKNENSSCWLRVSQAWAGGHWGAMHIPRIGQEVIVDFIDGNPDRPIITGRVYNADNMPPYMLPDEKNKSGFKSRSTKEGSGETFNELSFDDTKGEEMFTIHAEKDHSKVVENDENHSVGHDRTKNVKNDEAVTVGNDREENVGNDETITIGNDRKESVGNDETITIGNDRKESVDNDETITIGNDRKETVGNDDELEVGNDYTFTAKNDAEFKAKEFQFESETEIKLQVGSNYIEITKSGIIISGSQVNLTASGNVYVSGAKVNLNT